MPKTILDLDAFIRTVGINKASEYAFFLGAGASVSSGVPSAESCTWEWKRNIFVSNNPGLEPQFSELTLETIRHKIQKWLDSQNRYPELGSSIEYTFFVEECYRTNADRRTYFQEKIRELSA